MEWSPNYGCNSLLPLCIKALEKKHEFIHTEAVGKYQGVSSPLALLGNPYWAFDNWLSQGQFFIVITMQSGTSCHMLIEESIGTTISLPWT